MRLLIKGIESARTLFLFAKNASAIMKEVDEDDNVDNLDTNITVGCRIYYPDDIHVGCISDSNIRRRNSMYSIHCVAD